DESALGDGQISLREAIQAANTDTSVDGSVAGSGADTIVFAPALATGSIVMNDVLGDADRGFSSFLITSQITIQGTGQTFTQVVNPVMGPLGIRWFAVTGEGQLTLENLTLSGGLAQGGSGKTGGGAAGLGGAIYNQGTLTIIGCTLINNQAIGA